MARHVVSFLVTGATSVFVALVGYSSVFVAAAVGGGSIGSPLSLVLVPALAGAAATLITLTVVLPLSLAFSRAMIRRRLHGAIPPVLVLAVSVTTILLEVNYAADHFDEQTRLEIAARVIAVIIVFAGPLFAIYWAVLHFGRFTRRAVPSKSA